ncbi:DNA phosphorothioation-dependent restriction protein DptF [Sporosarcina pasteurii]|uniref:DNA phosphorothioation-dependent restriction protein DptF n=1 Tax=Sporosarcina pasteurii TaxID=1474 RepID=A0A380C3D6_SPOPA|nr:DNA phosphorothioation-dependent restriction protein DptF [Sporosarcina pasteurii]MDS9471544.1 DNA phosphorothioation-dependent restriction protein DptF [Sporosarcina pasteurii]SUJ10802.1 DNA phosphorothioation-dependent restriction protein DptF [Sporosarcina pasteurii]
MNKKVWHPLLDFLELDAGEESGVSEWIDSGETDLLTMDVVVQLQGAFLAISKYRMRNLAMLNQKPRISDSSFQHNNLYHTWLNIHKMYHCSKEELSDALKLNGFFEDIFTLPLTKQRKEEFVETYERFLQAVFELETSQSQRESVEKKEPEESIRLKQEVEKETVASLETTVLVEESSSLQSPKTFIEQLTVLQTSSIESVVHADVFTNFQHYMHVERPIQKQFIAALETAKRSSVANLVMLCGSVGDGKSHLISYVQEAFPQLLNNETCFIHNDSTESYNYSEDELETLERVLAPFEEGALVPKTTVIAINLGVLHNFYMKHEHTGEFEKVLRVIEKSEVFTTQQDYYYEEHDHATLLNFAGVQPYELSVEGIHSSFFNDIVERVSRPSNENPFYRLWEKEWNAGERTAAHINYHLLKDEEMRHALVKVLVEAMVKKKLFLSTRALYNLLYDVLVPLDNKHAVQPEQLLPYLLFERPDRSDLLHALHELDPIKRRDERFDERLSEYMLTSEPIAMIKQYLTDDESYLKLWESEDYMDESYLKLFLRHYYLLNHGHLNERYHQFLKYLYHYYIGEGGVIGEFFDYLDQVVESWIGSPIDGYLYIQPISKNEYSVAVPFKGEQDIGDQYGQFHNKETLNRFMPELTVGYNVEGTPVLISLDYTLFELIIHVAEGLRPGQQDYNEAIQFMEFYKDLIRNSDQTNDLIIVHRETNHIMRIKKPRFARGGKTYEVETVK